MLSLCGCAHMPSEPRKELEFQKWRVLETEQDTTFSSGNTLGERVNRWTQSFSNFKPFFEEAPALSLHCKSWYSCDARKRGQSRGVQKLHVHSVAATLSSSWFSKRPWLKRSKEKDNEAGHPISTSGLWICSLCQCTHTHTEISKITLQSGRLSISEEMVGRYVESWIRSWTQELMLRIHRLAMFFLFDGQKAPYSRGAVQAHWVSEFTKCDELDLMKNSWVLI